ncbi:hypothetical protein KPH14_005572 [Odynerus spinipes]|uniref:Uncharacterized protein n=1 Tax=Odynerus spinipes TaxID=1348599 RepID=A0AAD9VLL9_9HYME|nr:hypothetical protein KPH14_005572 [Odynerus spinipes]
MYGNAIHWKSKKQGSVTKSSTAAEYVALSEAVSELQLIRDILNDFKIKIDKPISVFEDNSGAITIAKFGNTITLINHVKKKHVVQYSEATGHNLNLAYDENESNNRDSGNIGHDHSYTGSSLISRPSTSQNTVILPRSQTPNVTAISESMPKRLRQMRLTAPTKINQKAGDEALLDMIVLDMQPLQIIENEGFRKYSKQLNPDYVLPSRKKLTQMLEEGYKICSGVLKEKLQNVQAIALTTDIWGSDSQKSFISVTAHFIKGPKLHALVISTSELCENHTSLNITNALRVILTEWQIFDKIVTIVTHNASGMK